MKNITIAYIGGGSMNFGWRLISELAGEEQLSGTVHLYDIDKQLSLANEVIGNRLRENPNCRSGLIYLAVDTLTEALRDADFVILSINHGTMEELVSDIHLPEMYGIYQSVGESTGPAGIARAIRTLPVYIEIAEKIKAYCPDAWVINLTNPMGVCLDMLYKVFPRIKAFGSSNEPFSAQELIAEFVAQENNIQSVPRREIKGNLIGINNFAWYDEVLYQGVDVTGIFRKFAERYSELGYEKRAGEFKINPFASANRIKFDLFLRCGVVAAAGDRHIAEFCPPWYIKNPKTAASWKLGMTTVNFLKKRKAEKSVLSKKLMNGDEQLKVCSSGTDCVAQIKALLGLGNLITNSDLPNHGQITNLPEGSIVQTNALFSNNSIKPVLAGALPDEVCALTLRHVYNQKTIVKSVLKKDLDIAFNAFLNDPLVTADIDSATELYREMLSRMRSHLIYFC